MSGNSRAVSSNQVGPHPDLRQVTATHGSHRFRKPIADFNAQAFAQVTAWLQDHPGVPWILDSGCGVGESTRWLSREFPDHLVVGVDRSAIRLERQHEPTPDNARFVRADLVDFWRLAAAEACHPARHYLLYPNPYPKKRQLKQRWHAHPVFPALRALGGKLECRSNWIVYLQEMAFVLAESGTQADLHRVTGAHSITAFERKYRASGQICWALTANLTESGPSGRASVY